MDDPDFYDDEDHAYNSDDDEEADWDDEDGDDDCGLLEDGQCLMAGTEHCDFECPNRNSEFFCGSRAWCRKRGVAYR